MANRRDPAIRELFNVKTLCVEKGVGSDIIKKLEDVIVLAEARDAYCVDITSANSDALKTISAETMTYPFEDAYKAGNTIDNLNPGMMSGHLEGCFLQSLLSMANAKRVLEIGMFTGYAALAMAEVLPDDGTVTTCEIDPFLEELAKSFFSKSPHGKKINIRIGPAKDTLLKLADDGQQFDFVFIDADKNGYKEYFEIITEKNVLAPGGTIVFDNAFMAGHAYNPASTAPNGLAIRACNEYLKTRDDFFRVLVPIRDGALIVRRRNETFKSTNGM